VVSPKIDGVAIALRYDATGRLHLAATRGNGFVGEEVTAQAHRIAEIPHRISEGELEVRGEVFMRRSVFARYAGKFANPRNLAAGALKQKDPRKTAEYELSFFAYDLLGREVELETEKIEMLRHLGFVPIESSRTGKEGMIAEFRRWAARREALDYETDGVVFKVNRISEQRRLGETAHHPRYAIAYKFQGESAVTTLEDVIWSVARSGVVTPVGIIAPVTLSGATVTRASLHNAGNVEKLGLTRNARVEVMRRGGVIPHIEFVVEAGDEPVALPDRCPSCGGPLRREEDFLYCARPDRCRDVQIGRLAHFIDRIGCEGFGPRLLEQLYDTGLVREFADFFRLRTADLLPLERMGETLARKLVANVQAHRTIPLATFLEALGIPELGKHVATILARYGSLDRIRRLTEEELTAIHSIGAVIARSVVEGLARHAEEIDHLLEFVTVTPGEDAEKPQGPLAGKKVLFTGKLQSMERKEAQNLVTRLGGRCPSGVSRDLDFLVVGEERGGKKSTKHRKAEALNAQGAGIRILTEAEFLEMIPKV
ncbi:MAG: DNA ligase (NAD(+)) LigA, partial [Deltaproteobacteria bacterium]